MTHYLTSTQPLMAKASLVWTAYFRDSIAHRRLKKIKKYHLNYLTAVRYLTSDKMINDTETYDESNRLLSDLQLTPVPTLPPIWWTSLRTENWEKFIFNFILCVFPFICIKRVFLPYLCTMLINRNSYKNNVAYLKKKKN